MDLEDIEYLCKECTRCDLSKTRYRVVVGAGNTKTDIMFVGEAPGEQEDNQGRVFVGPAGMLLDKMFASINIKREDVYLTNIVKCRPPKNRNPKKEEQDACIPYLRWQVKLIHPKIIVCLGRIAAQVIIDKDFKITSGHGEWIERGDYLLFATFHPSALLRDPEKKRPAYEDLKKIRKKLDEIRAEKSL